MSETSVYSRPDPFEVPDGGLASFLTADVGQRFFVSTDAFYGY